MFIQEPPNQVDFSNTTGMEVICQSRGTPLPRITWVRQDGHKWVVAEDVPGLRQVRNLYNIINRGNNCVCHFILNSNV